MKFLFSLHISLLVLANISIAKTEMTLITIQTGDFERQIILLYANFDGVELEKTLLSRF